MKVLVGSKNPVKIKSTRKAFSQFFENLSVEGRSVPSGVPAQPAGDEVFRGAENRARSLMVEAADFYVGIEGGLTKIQNKVYNFAVFCIIDSRGKKSFGTSPSFELPENIVSELNAGGELGPIIDKLVGDKNIKQKGGAIWYLSKGAITRTEFYVQGLMLALVPFVHEWYI